jgi:thymidylate kinase
VALLLDVPPEVVVSRLKAKKSVMENMANLRKVRDLYVRLAEQKRMVSLDGNRSIKEVADSILLHVLRELKPSR